MTFTKKRGWASDLAGRASEQTGRSSEVAWRGSDPARTLEPAGKFPVGTLKLAGTSWEGLRASRKDIGAS